MDILSVDEILHHFATMGNHCWLVFTGESPFQGFLGGAGFRPSTVCKRGALGGGSALTWDHRKRSACRLAPSNCWTWDLLRLGRSLPTRLETLQRIYRRPGKRDALRPHGPVDTSERATPRGRTGNVLTQATRIHTVATGRGGGGGGGTQRLNMFKQGVESPTLPQTSRMVPRAVVALRRSVELT